MAITTYTSTEQIRSALGLSKTEISDAVLMQEQWDTLLLLDLESVSANLPTSYATISGIVEGSRTAAETKVYLLTRLFAILSVAKSLIPAVNMFSVQSLTDGKASFERQDDVQKQLFDGLIAQYSAIKAALAAAYLQYDPAAAVIASVQTLLTVTTGLGVDPVTTTNA